MTGWLAAAAGLRRSQGLDGCHQRVCLFWLAHTDANVARQLLLGIVAHHDASLSQGILHSLGITAL